MRKLISPLQLDAGSLFGQAIALAHEVCLIVARVAAILAALCLAQDVVPMVLTAQVVRDNVPLRHWPAPLYWQPDLKDLHPFAATPTQTGPLTFIAITPCRVMDTRSGSGFTGAFGPPSLTAGGTPREVPIPSSSCGVPSNAGAYSLNITAVSPGGIAYLMVWPEGQPLPNVSTLSATFGGAVANAAIVAAGTGGAIQMLSGNPTDVIIDINGYYAASFVQLPGGLSQFGVGVLQQYTSGYSNTAAGASALYSNTTGASNTAAGDSALYSNITGSNNIAIGYNAAKNVAGGNSNNIHIGTQGSSSDNGTIRIGGNTNFFDPANQTQFFVSGVRGITTANNDAIPVVIDSGGQLGTVNSSRRYKQDIQDMGYASSGLMRLRPVTFRNQKPFADGSKPIQYGLIAEEVAEVYPDLVVHSSDGQIETVKYQVLDSLLLNEVQRLNKENQVLQERLSRLEAVLTQLAALQKLP
jgi:hypothetical protein